MTTRSSDLQSPAPREDRSGNELRLPVLTLPGLSPDSLGNYLASLGLLRVLSRKWPSTRIAWRDEVVQVVGGPPTLDDLLDELVRVAGTQAESDARKREWTQYHKAWSDAQKKGTKAKSGAPLALWQAQADENHLELFAAHAVPHARVSFNPLLGSGGNAGRRDFAAGWKKAVDALDGAIKTLEEAEEKHAQALAEAAKERDDARAKADEKHQAALKKAGSTRTEAARANAKAKADEARTKAYVNADEKHRAALQKANDAFDQAVHPSHELKNLLQGQPTTWMLEKLGAGSWFSEATKLYNSGQSPAREGRISPWAMVLACEGLALLVGGASRRLGARSRAAGAFPFVTLAIASETAGEAGRIRGEVWTPIWSRPMTLAETITLFSRGRAELCGRGALTPAAFATAIRKRGVDAGVSEFRRFTLGRTTSANTFEPRLEGRFMLNAGAGVIGAAHSLALERVTALIEQRGFPRDRKRFIGLRGPIESALLEVAAEPSRAESGVTLLDSVLAALDRIDRNRGFREGNVRWEPLPLEWLQSLFAEEQPGAEARLALSLVSAFPMAQPFATYRFGVEWKYGPTYANYTHVERPPPRWVWGPGNVPRVIGAVLSRRLLDQEAEAENARRAQAPLPAGTSQVCQWLTGNVDERLFSVWLSRLALFDWRKVPQEMRTRIHREVQPPRVDGQLALLGLLQPLVDRRSLVVQSMSPNDLLADETGARTTEAARSLVTLTRSGKIDAVLRLARSRYAMAGARLASFDVAVRAHDPDRLVAALLFTISGRDRAVLFERWLRPGRRQQGGEPRV